MEVEKPLTPKQERFCQEFIIDCNGTQAAIRSGYSKKSAMEQASRLLSYAKVSARIKELTAVQLNKLNINAEMVLKELLLIARSDIGEAFNDKEGLKSPNDLPENFRRAVSGIEYVELFEGRGRDREQVGYLKKVKLWEKTKALDLLGKYLKLWVEKEGISKEELAAITRPTIILNIPSNGREKKS